MLIQAGAAAMPFASLSTCPYPGHEPSNFIVAKAGRDGWRGAVRPDWLGCLVTGHDRGLMEPPTAGSWGREVPPEALGTAQ